MTTKKEHDEVIKDEKDAEKAYQADLKRDKVEQSDTRTPLAEVQPGCSAPDQVSPSVVGTTHDPKRVVPTDHADKQHKHKKED